MEQTAEVLSKVDIGRCARFNLGDHHVGLKIGKRSYLGVGHTPDEAIRHLKDTILARMPNEKENVEGLINQLRVNKGSCDRMAARNLYEPIAVPKQKHWLKRFLERVLK